MNRSVEMTSVRQQALTQWAEQQLSGRGWQFQSPLTLAALSGDAGFRRYFRLNTVPCLLAVFAPPEVEKNEAFVALAEHFVAQGIHAPEVVAVNYSEGFLLLEDFGDRLLSGELNDDSVDMLYGEALLTLMRLQQCPVRDVATAEGGCYELPAYDAALLQQEMSLLHEWFIPQLLGYTLSVEEEVLLQGVYEALTASALEQPAVCVHRDYHSRNLMYRDGQAPGVIDFQDAVQGPITYDLVSLLRDCYVRWPADRVERWALAYGTMLEDAGMLQKASQQQWLRWFDWMGLQRHIKVLGIFARLHLRDGKDGYLNDLPLVIRYTLEVAERYPELTAFADWFKERLLPLCEQQGWYCDYRTAGDR